MTTTTRISRAVLSQYPLNVALSHTHVLFLHLACGFGQVNPVLNGAPASILPNEFLAGLNADNKNEWVTVVMLSHVYALKVKATGRNMVCFSRGWGKGLFNLSGR